MAPHPVLQLLRRERGRGRATTRQHQRYAQCRREHDRRLPHDGRSPAQSGHVFDRVAAARLTITRHIFDMCLCTAKGASSREGYVMEGSAVDTSVLVVGSIALIALSGLTILAFKEPPVFGTILPFLMLVLAVLFLSSSIWSLAIVSAADSAHRAISELEGNVMSRVAANAAYSRATEMELPMGWITLSYFAILGYLYSLRRIPLLLNPPKQQPGQAER